jgi:hypothetical protein
MSMFRNQYYVVEVAVIDYEASMIAFENPELKGVTAEIKKRLEKVINNI